MSSSGFDPEEVLFKLTREEKIALLSGDDMWHTAPVPRLGIPRVRVSSGGSLSRRASPGIEAEGHSSATDQ